MIASLITLGIASWLWTAITVAYVAAVAGVAFIIIADNGNPTKSLAWVTVVVLLPVLGLLLYLFLGRDLKGTRVISRRNRRRLQRKEVSAPVQHRSVRLEQENSHLVKMGVNTSDAAFYPDAEVAVFADGESFFKALLDDMEKAEKYINLQYYIFADDNIGSRMASIMMAKAQAGVKVRLIYDHVGCIDVPEEFFDNMRRAGVTVEPFFKVQFPRTATRLNWRNHRKAVIIDGRVGYIGGMNVADRYITGGTSFGSWRDTSVRITGGAVAGLQYHFAVDWSFMGGGILDDTVTDVTDGYPGATPGVGVQIITGGPTSRYSGIALTFFRAIASARKRVYIQTPYFLPNEALLTALQAAALSGVDCRVMVPAVSDSAILAYATRSFVTECIGAGIRFYFYDKGMLHCKVLIVDDEFSTIGSANFDYRSLEHNFEENVMMYSREMNGRLVGQFESDMEACTRVYPREWHRRGRMDRLKESLCRMLSPML